jgi:hypothetical protein
MDSVILAVANVVLYPFLNPNWYSLSILFSSKNLFNRLAIAFSIILPKIDEMEIGQKLLISRKLFFLRTGITKFSLRQFGKTPVLKQRLIMIRNGLIRKPDALLISFAGVRASTRVFHGLKDFSYFGICHGSKKEGN